MKNFLSFCLLALCLLVTGNAYSQNKPFIEKGKLWHLRVYTDRAIEYGLHLERPDMEYDLGFADDCDVVIDGVTYQRMTYQNVVCNIPGSLKDGRVKAILREENGKVYQYNENSRREILLYDFTLKEGDEFELQDFSSDGTYKCKVEEVTYIEVNGQKLKSILFTSRYSKAFDEDEEPIWTRWTECIGDDSPVLQPRQSWGIAGGLQDYTYYVTYSDNTYLPLTTGPSWNVQGRQMTMDENVVQDVPEDKRGHDDLKYEISADGRLHIYGYIWTAYSKNQYAYLLGTQKPDTSPLFAFETVTLEPKSGSEAAHYVDLYFTLPSGFQNGIVTVRDREGEHIAVKAETSVPVVLQNEEEQPAYDMMGRRLQAVPAKGMYIQNGRKIQKR